jgi:hypothetical protein
VRLVDAEHRDELLAQRALDRGQAGVSLGEARKPLDALEEPLHPKGSFCPLSLAADGQVIRAWVPRAW